MKKLLVLMLAMLFATSAFAEEAEITFRGFEWYAQFPEVDSALDISDQDHNFSRYIYDDSPMDSINGALYSTEYSDDHVRNSGVFAVYWPLDVAGHEADLSLYFMYPIVDGVLLKDRSKAEMYLGVYNFDIDYPFDANIIYEELRGKLTKLYGEGIQKTSAYHTITSWEDADENTIWLVLDNASGEVRIAYAAGDHKMRLLEIDNIGKNGNAVETPEIWEQIKDDTSGL